MGFDGTRAVKCLGAFWWKNNSYYDRIFCCMSESKGSLKFEFNAHLKNENSQKRSHKMVMKGRITYE